MYGIRAWHVIHGAPYHGGLHLKLIMNAVNRLAPPKKPLRPPVTRFMIELLFQKLDPTSSEDVCVLCGAAVAFWCQNRLGELFAASSRTFDPKLVPKRCDLGPSSALNGSLPLHLPYTKVAGFRGEDVRALHQLGTSDPVAAIHHHLLVNRVPENLPLLSYCTALGWTYMTKTHFLAICNRVWIKAGIPSAVGHSFRIGGTTELLMRGVDPEIVKVMGRWTSDAFLRYCRCLDDIIPLHAQLLDPESSPPRQRQVRRTRKRVSFAN